VTSFLRVFFVGGGIAYRGLFNWVRPRVYIPTMLIGPLFQILFFAYLGRYSGLENDAFFVVGNAVQYSAMSSVFARCACCVSIQSRKPGSSIVNS